MNEIFKRIEPHNPYSELPSLLYTRIPSSTHDLILSRRICSHQPQRHDDVNNHQNTLAPLWPNYRPLLDIDPTNEIRRRTVKTLTQLDVSANTTKNGQPYSCAQLCARDVLTLMISYLTGDGIIAISRTCRWWYICSPRLCQLDLESVISLRFVCCGSSITSAPASTSPTGIALRRSIVSLNQSASARIFNKYDIDLIHALPSLTRLECQLDDDFFQSGMTHTWRPFNERTYPPFRPPRHLLSLRVRNAIYHSSVQKFVDAIAGFTSLTSLDLQIDTIREEDKSKINFTPLLQLQPTLRHLTLFLKPLSYDQVSTLYQLVMGPKSHMQDIDVNNGELRKKQFEIMSPRSSPSNFQFRALLQTTFSDFHLP